MENERSVVERLYWEFDLLSQEFQRLRFIPPSKREQIRCKLGAELKKIADQLFIENFKYVGINQLLGWVDAELHSLRRNADKRQEFLKKVADLEGNQGDS